MGLSIASGGGCCCFFVGPLLSAGQNGLAIGAGRRTLYKPGIGKNIRELPTADIGRGIKGCSRDIRQGGGRSTDAITPYRGRIWMGGWTRIEKIDGATGCRYKAWRIDDGVDEKCF